MDTFIKNRGKRMIPLLEEVYKNMTHDDLMVSAYQLMYIAPEKLTNWMYGHIVFEDLNLGRDNIEFCIKNASEADYVYEDLDGIFNIQTIELLICLKHLLIKDRIKVMFNDIGENLIEIMKEDDADEHEDYDDLKEEFKRMRKAGYTPESIMKERRKELERYEKLGLLDAEVVASYM